MDLLQLQYFLLLASQQHVTKTAAMLNISQPSLSATIKKLETELGVPLFIRKGRNIELSPYGEAYKQYVEEAFLALDNGKATIEKLRGTNTHKLSLGILSPYVWEDFFQEFHALYPETKLNRYSIEGSHYADDLIAGKIDFYLGGINHIDSLDAARLQYTTLYEDEMVLLLPAQHPMAKETSIDLRQCKNERFINQEAGTNLQQFVSSLFEKAGFAPNVIMICDYTLRDRMVAEGHGISITTRLAAQKSEVQGLAYVPISNPAEKRKLGLVWRKNRLFSQSMQNFYDTARRFYDGIYGE